MSSAAARGAAAAVTKMELDQETTAITSASSTATATTATATPTNSAPRSRALEENELRAWARVDRHPHDTSAWKLLVDNAIRDISTRTIAPTPPAESTTTATTTTSSSTAAHALPIVLERFFTLFPTASGVWARVVDAQLVANTDNAKGNAWAERALAACGGAAAAPVPVWMSVVRAARAVHSIDTAAGREAVQTCFESAVASCGGDLNALSIWREYLEFVRVAGDAAQLEETRRMTALRSLYQRALSQPLLDLELLWRQYDAFEQKISKVLAKGLLQEHSARYMVARQCGRQLAVHGAGADLDALAVPPTGRLGEPLLAASWQRLIAFERTNAAQLDDAGCAARVARCYEQCLLVMRHYPHVWFDYSATRLGANDAAGARSILLRATTALPSSALLSFALAQTQELAGEVDSALRTLEQLLEKAPSPIAWARAIQVTARAQSRDAARKLFMRARKSPQCSWQPYVIAAQLELDDRELKVARNIFEFGLREHANEPLFVEQYVELLLAAGRPQDARALLERVLATSADDVALPIWNLLVRVERASGDAAAERTAEARRAERYAELDPASLRNTLARFGLLGMQACSPSELAAASAAHDVIAPSDVLASLRARPRAVPTDPSAVLAADAARAAELEAIRKVAESLPRPDIDNMTPFLPLEDPDAAGGAGTALGVLRPSLRGVLERLPSARSYNGPIIDAEIVVRLLLATRIPPHVRLDTLDAFTPAAAREVALSSAAAATLKRKQPPGSAANAIGGGGGGGGGGVGGGVGGDDDVPFGGTHTVSTSTDIFRARRADKVRRGI